MSNIRLLARQLHLLAVAKIAACGGSALSTIVYLHVQVIELPIKHPELFESLGVAQPKVCASSKKILHSCCAAFLFFSGRYPCNPTPVC